LSPRERRGVRELRMVPEMHDTKQNIVGELFRRHKRELLACLARTVGRDSAPDLLQDTFARALGYDELTAPVETTSVLGDAAEIVVLDRPEPDAVAGSGKLIPFVRWVIWLQGEGPVRCEMQDELSEYCVFRQLGLVEIVVVPVYVRIPGQLYGVIWKRVGAELLDLCIGEPEVEAFAFCSL